jgi:type VI secretion system protein ImpL
LKQQKQQREETLDPLSIELNAQQRYLDRWLLRLQRHLDSRRYLWQLPWYMAVGPAGSGKTALLREGFPSDIIYTPEAVRGTEQRLYITPHVGQQAVIFDTQAYSAGSRMPIRCTAVCGSTGLTGWYKNARASRSTA